MEDDRSYDNTEPTPQPHLFRPPLPSHHPVTHSMTQQQSPTTALLNHSILSYGDSLDGLAADESSSFPSFDQEPPSPMTRPSSSLLGGSQASTTANNTRNTRLTPRSQPPPLSEVHVENEEEEEDRFHECFEDGSLARRAQRSLRASPGANNINNHKSQRQSTADQRHVSYASRSTSSAVSQSSGSASIDLSSISQIHMPSTPGASSMPSHTASPVAHLPSPRNLSRSTAAASSSSRHHHRHHHNQSTTTVNQSSRSQDLSTDDVLRVHQSSLDTLMKMKEELLKATQAKDSLEQEKQSLQQERDSIHQEFQTYKSNQGYQLQQLKVEKQAWLREKRDMEVQLRAADRLKKDNMHRRLAADNRQKEFKAQVDDLQLDLEEARAQKDLLSSNVETLQKSNGSLKEQNAELAKELEEQKSTNSMLIQDLKKKVQDTEEQMGHIQKVAESKTEEAEKLRKKLTKYATALKEAKQNLKKQQPTLKHPPSYSVDQQQSQQQQPQGEGLDMSVTNRLAKMRDSAERAQMVRLHKRELARLQMDKDVQLQKLVAEHEETMRKLHKDSSLKLNAKLEEVRNALKEEYDDKFTKMEKQHNDKFAALQKEYLRSQEDSDEALQVALGKVAEASKEYEKEAARREGAQKTLEQLKKKLVMDKRMVADKYEQEFKKQLAQWEHERETLLTVVQKDCNNAFESHRKGFRSTTAAANNNHNNNSHNNNNRSLNNKSMESQRTSPTSTLHTFFPPAVSVDADDRSYLGNGSIRSSSQIPMISPSESDLESDLKYTEDLIAGLL